MRYPVTWIDSRYVKTSNLRIPGYLGLCPLGKRVFYASPVPDLAEVPAVVEMTGEGCSRARACIALDCPHNRTTKESWAEAAGHDAADVLDKAWSAMTGALASIPWEEVETYHDPVTPGKILRWEGQDYLR